VSETSAPAPVPAADTSVQTTIILAEVALHRIDAERIVGLHPGEPLAYHVVVPTDTEYNVLAAFLDHLSLFEMRAALAALKPVDRAEATTDAQEALEASIALLDEAGGAAYGEPSGELADDDPLPRIRELVAQLDPYELIVVTRPHAVEDSFHADWASRAREEFGIPVLHLYAGDWRVG